ncbi:hypothetical protein HY945_03300 [Candidatus Gottesmanbacteria bacterium]|nr:hypothetical protein [Candidatus Gottesmanbacteria bacterium]
MLNDKHSPGRSNFVTPSRWPKIPPPLGWRNRNRPSPNLYIINYKTNKIFAQKSGDKMLRLQKK